MRCHRNANSAEKKITKSWYHMHSVGILSTSTNHRFDLRLIANRFFECWHKSMHIACQSTLATFELRHFVRDTYAHQQVLPSAVHCLNWHVTFLKSSKDQPSTKCYCKTMNTLQYLSTQCILGLLVLFMGCWCADIEGNAHFAWVSVAMMSVK